MCRLPCRAASRFLGLGLQRLQSCVSIPFPCLGFWHDSLPGHLWGGNRAITRPHGAGSASSCSQTTLLCPLSWAAPALLSQATEWAFSTSSSTSGQSSLAPDFMQEAQVKPPLHRGPVSTHILLASHLIQPWLDQTVPCGLRFILYLRISARPPLWDSLLPLKEPHGAVMGQDPRPRAQGPGPDHIAGIRPREQLGVVSRSPGGQH